ncbi:MAG: ferrochelatase [Zoogloeaceae bacterium]|jgi:ferrochelatase|nr:ferrochelatase [Zoogloeaceae bacterium]
MSAPSAHTGILLINLGTPDAPTPTALRRYLKEFLLDKRVVERKGFFSRLLWRLILYGFILPFRARKSAAKYALIWDGDSPLRTHTRLQAEGLRQVLLKRGLPVSVFWAMRYGKPEIASTLSRMQAEGIKRLLVLPLYPQYSASTTASALDAVCAWLLTCRNQPELRVIRSFPTHPAYLNALEAQVRNFWAEHGALPPEGRLVLSFHGLPKKSRALGDPYYDECLQTAKQLAERLDLDEQVCWVTFQSRFGREAWLEPDTFYTLQELAWKGARRVDVFCPGFAADCLETLEEIALVGRQVFLRTARGEVAVKSDPPLSPAGDASPQNDGDADEPVFNYIPALNESDAWIEALADLVDEHLAWDGRKQQGE